MEEDIKKEDIKEFIKELTILKEKEYEIFIEIKNIFTKGKR